MAPACPEWLDEIGKAKWHELSGVFLKRKLLRQEDEIELAAICAAWSDVVNARKQLAKLKGKDGTLNMLVQSGNSFAANPLYYIIKNALQVINAFGSQFGLSPAARARLTFDEEPSGPETPKGLEAVLSGKTERDPSDPDLPRVN